VSLRLRVAHQIQTFDRFTAGDNGPAGGCESAHLALDRIVNRPKHTFAFRNDDRVRPWPKQLIASGRM
jgi:hypothetical protein